MIEAKSIGGSDSFNDERPAVFVDAAAEKKLVRKLDVSWFLLA